MPISSEQWRRLDQVMAKNGEWPSGRLLLASSMVRGWYWFIAFPLIATAALWSTKRAIASTTMALVAGPSVVALVFALAYRSAMPTVLQ